MLRNLSHSSKILKYGNNFLLYVFLTNNCNINNANINIYTNKLVEFGYFNFDLENFEQKENFLTVSPEIYFPKKSFFATYKYKLEIDITKETALIVVGNNELENMKFEIFNNNNNNYDKKNKYIFTIQKENHYLEF